MATRAQTLKLHLALIVVIVYPNCCYIVAAGADHIVEEGVEQQLYQDALVPLLSVL